MRPMMLMSFAIVATLAIVTAGTFAATTRSLQRATAPDAGTTPFELMVNSKNLPSPQYGEPF